MKNTLKILFTASITLSSLHAAPILLDTKGVPPETIGGNDVPITHKNTMILLYHARALQQAIQMATLDAYTSKKKSAEWTSSYDTVESLQKYLIDQGYLKKDIGEIFFQHLKVARITDQDSSETIVIVSDNYPDAKNSDTSKLTGNNVIIFTKGGAGQFRPMSHATDHSYSLPKSDPQFLKSVKAEQDAAANP